MPPSPLTRFLTHLSSDLLPALLAHVLPRADATSRHGAPLTALIRARLTEIAGAIRTLLTAAGSSAGSSAGAPPGPRKARKPRPPVPPRLRLVPAVVSEYVCYPEGTPAEPPPEPPPPEKPVRLPTHYRWLTKLFPEFLRDRHALEDQLREQAVKDAIAADPRLARAVRKLAWMLGVQRNLIPPGRKRGQVFLVADSNVAKAHADYAEGLKTMTHEEIMAKWVKFPDDPWMRKAREVSRDKRHNHDKRPVWFGPDLRPPDFGPDP